MSSGLTRAYAPDDVAVVVGTQAITGFKEGTFVEVERDVETAVMDIGSDGEATLVISPNQAGKFKFTLQQSSPSNDYLTTVFQALQNKDLTNGIKPVSVEDKNGSTLASCKQGAVQKPAKVSFADKAEGREWTIVTGYLNLAPGGENVIGS